LNFTIDIEDKGKQCENIGRKTKGPLKW